MSGKRDSISQKWFTIQFTEKGSSEVKTTKIPAKKGKTLKESVEPVLENHGMSVETHSIFLEASQTPLPVASETFPYGGSVLHIRANEVVKEKLDKRIFSLMKDSGKTSPDSKKKRFSGLLRDYEENGFSVDEVFDDVIDGEEEEKKADEFFLENSWKDVINAPDDMTDRQRVQQEAIWELFTSEVTYINDLTVIKEVFEKCFLELQKEGYLQDVDQALIYANVDEIHKVNVEFWNLLKRVLDEARTTKELVKPSQLVEAFDEFEDLFQPYIEYCNSDPSNMKLPTYTTEVNDMLKEYITWCDNHERCKRIQLTGFLIKPLQRVTKYSLLIRAILSKTDDEPERLELEDLMSRVETFVSKINSHVRMRQEHEKLVSVLSKFDTYSPVEAVNDEAEKVMSEYCGLNLKETIPGLPEDEKRHILKDGPMKLVEKQTRKDVHVFLFSDVLVITKLKRNIDKYRVIRQPFRLNKIVIRVLKDPGSFLFLYLNEYGVMSTAFVLQINSEEQAKWLTAFEKAKVEYLNLLSHSLRMTCVLTNDGLISATTVAEIKQSFVIALHSQRKDFEKLRIDYAISKDDFINDDIPSSVISKNRLLSTRASNRKSKCIERTTSTKDLVPSPLDSWTNTRIIMAATAFCLINVLISRLFGYS